MPPAGQIVGSIVAATHPSFATLRIAGSVLGADALVVSVPSG